MDFNYYLKSGPGSVLPWGLSIVFVTILYFFGIHDFKALLVFFLLIPLFAPFGAVLIRGGNFEATKSQYRKLFPALPLVVSIPLGLVIVFCAMFGAYYLFLI